MAYEHAVVLTGGIATGKSTAAALLAMLGFRIIDADAIAREVMSKQTPAVAEAFGEGVLESEGTVDRKKLGALVFADELARKRLEAILHPPIREEIHRQSEAQERLGKPYLIDIPLFYETGGDYPIERVAVVYAPRETQLRRLMERDGFDESEATRRLNAQLDIEEKRRHATWVLDNSGSLKELQQGCEELKEKILESFVRA